MNKPPKVEGSGPRKCVICGDYYYGFGNNADPIANGQCCDACNWTRVIPKRLANLRERHSKENY